MDVELFQIKYQLVDKNNVEMNQVQAQRMACSPCKSGIFEVSVRGPSTQSLPSVPTAMPSPKYIPPHCRHSTVHILALSANHQLVITSLPFHFPHHSPIIPSPLFLLFPFSLSSLIFSRLHCLLHYSPLLWYHFYLLTPKYPHLYLYTFPFLAEIPIFFF